MPRGNATLVGLAVNQSGRSSATTSVSENGSVLLLARSDTVTGINAAGGTVFKRATSGGALTLGSGSRISLQPDITRDADGQVAGVQPTSSDNAGFTASRVELAGRSITLQADSRIKAPGAWLRARACTPDYDIDPLAAHSAGTVDAGARLSLADGAVIDVAGSRSAQVSVARNFITTEPLGSNDLKDAALQKLGPLYRSRATFDLRSAVPILGDTSSYRQAIEQTAAERLSAGGQVRLESTGTVATQAGSRIDVSGGQLRYTAASVAPTLLLADDGSRYSLNNDPADLRYLGIKGVDGYYTRRDAAGARSLLQSRWGAAVRYSVALGGHDEPGYVDGRAGGPLRILAGQAVLDGGLRAVKVIGERQLAGRDALAAASQFRLGSIDNAGSFGSAGFAGTGLETSLRVGDGSQRLSDAFWASPLDSGAPPAGSRLARASLIGAGFGSLLLATEGSLQWPPARR